MKIASILALFCLCLCSFGCSDDSSTGPEENPPEAIASATIGPEGGDLEHERFRLRVPAGAFDTESTVELFVSDESAPFGESAVSELFYLEGLPDHWNQPLGLEVAYNGALSGESFIAFGQESFVISAGATDVVYRLLPASESPIRRRSPTQSLDVLFIATDIPPLEETDSPHHVAAVSHMGPVTSSKGHFLITYPTGHVTAEQARQLGEYLEEAYTMFGKPDGFGFSYDARTSWPVDVLVKEMNPEISGVHEASMWGNNYATISFNQAEVSDAADMRLTAGHEFFHLVQMLYDQRNAYWKAKEGGPNVWLEEACSVWSEELFTEQAGYVSDSRKDNEFQPFRGLQAGVAVDARRHGYGMSSLIKYLVEDQGTGILIKFFEATQQQKTPAEAVLSNVPRPVESWLPAFFRGYLIGNYYGGDSSYFFFGISDRFTVLSEQDEVAHFRSADPKVGLYPDLSAKLFLVEIRDPSLDRYMNLQVTATGSGTQPWIGLFEYRHPTLTYIVGRRGSATAEDLGGFLTRDSHILACVVNSDHQLPECTGSASIDTEMKVIRSRVPSWEYCEFGMRVNTTLRDQDENVTSVDNMYFEGRCNGTFTDYKFTGSWEAAYDWGTLVGDMYVVLDPTLGNVDSVSVVGSTDFHNGRTDEWTVIAQGVPLSIETDEWAYYSVVGLETCNRLDDLGYTTYYGETFDTLVGQHCSQNSEMRVTFGPRQ